MSITAERLRELLEYSPDTGFFRWRKTKRGNMVAGKVAGTRNKALGYIIICVDDCDYYGHRLAWLYAYGSLPSVIDHINGIRSDNRLSNLRAATAAENSRNIGVRSDSQSGLKGVRRVGNVWRASIKINGRVRHLGYHKTMEEAARAYGVAARESFGDFAR